MHPVLFHIGAFYIPSYGALSALGVLLALFVAQCTARVVRVNPAQLWNLCVIALFAAIAGQRLLLIAVNWSDIRLHPAWMLGLAMIHHPLLAGAGSLAGLLAAFVFARWQRMPLAATADALAAPLAVGLACEQMGTLLAGAGFGTETSVRWAVTYTSPLAARWSGTPLGVPLHPVQGYAAIGFLGLSLLLVALLPVRHQPGDVAGLGLAGTGVLVFITEVWRDTAGRGSLLHGAIDGPQAAAVALVMAGGLLLLERKSTPATTQPQPRSKETEAHHA